MPWLQNHLRKTFLAGIFGVLPIAVTVFIVWWVDQKTRAIATNLHLPNIPFLGAVIAIVAIYLGGLIITSLLGKWFLRRADLLLSRMPVLKPLYLAWKQIALTPGGGEGMFGRVCLIPADAGQSWQLGFTNGEPVEGNSKLMCVFVPAAPNPVNGRLFLVAISDCRIIDVSAEEAFKMILSTGNYLPPGIAVN